MIQFNYEKKITLEEALMQLYSILGILRGPNGCPWDKKQSLKDVAYNLIGETYEYIDALNLKENDLISEELGDTLLNIMMLLVMHSEKENRIDVIDSINLVCEKLIRRHPHVFDDAVATNSEEVLDLWNEIKREVEGKKESTVDFFERIPNSIQQLEESYEIQKKMEKVGFDWPDVIGVFEKIDEEYNELKQAIENKELAAIEAELGDLLFSVVNLGRFLKIRSS
ncbi:MAG: MazG family protein, partial [Sphaerochaetaceae bacterium]